MSRKIRSCDSGTAFEVALLDCDRIGPPSATDAQNMAAFCEDIMQRMVGAFSPRLVWEGAQKAGLTTLQLHQLCHEKNLAALDDLQFS